MLRPGMSVLDVGCGTGAISAGIAGAVGPDGQVVGIDRDEGLVDLARREHGTLPNLRFELGDVTTMDYRAQFDVVTAARTLQWIARPEIALAKIRDAARPGGMIVVLDYSHVKNQWKPEAPPAFQHFYQAFLAWRQANHWDNRMADHLPTLFQAAGLVETESHIQDEIVERGDADFAERSALWAEVIERTGEQLVKAQCCTQSQLQEAHETYTAWVRTEFLQQSLWMRTVTGRVP